MRKLRGQGYCSLHNSSTIHARLQHICFSCLLRIGGAAHAGIRSGVCAVHRGHHPDLRPGHQLPADPGLPIPGTYALDACVMFGQFFCSFSGHPPSVEHNDHQRPPLPRAFGSWGRERNPLLPSCVLCRACCFLPASFHCYDACLVQANACAAALLWVGLLRYVEHNQSYFSVVLTLRRGIPRVLRYLVRPLCTFL